LVVFDFAEGRAGRHAMQFLGVETGPCGGAREVVVEALTRVGAYPYQRICVMTQGRSHMGEFCTHGSARRRSAITVSTATLN
jgi:hypothetical protein